MKLLRFLILFLFSQIAFAQQWESLGPFGIPAMSHPDDFTIKMANGNGRVGALKFLYQSKTSSVHFLCTPFGGLWKSSDAGKNWSPIKTDLIPTAGVADIEFHPKNKSTWFLVTGDVDCILDKNGPSLSSEFCQSRGIYKTIDGGKTWKGPIGNWQNEKGEADTAFWNFPSNKVIRKLLIDQADPKVMHVVIHTYNYSTKSYDGFIYTSRDGGQNWKVSLFALDGILKDIEFKPGKSNVMFASGRTVYRSDDKGKTWKSLLHNGLLSDSLTARCEVEISKTNPNVVFVLAVNQVKRQNELYRSDDSGNHFSKVGSIASSPEWRTTMVVDADSPDRLYLSAANKVMVLVNVKGQYKPELTVTGLHDDLHVLTIEPRTKNLLASTDGGLYVSTDKAKTWKSICGGLSVAECWGVSVSQTGKLKVLAGLQDCGTILGLEDSSQSIEWKTVRGGDGMKPAIDPTDANVMYHGDGNNNILARTDNGGEAWGRNLAVRGKPSIYQRPFMLNPKDQNSVFSAYDALYESNDRGATFHSNSSAVKTSAVPNISAIAISFSDTNYRCIAFCNPSWDDKTNEKLFLTKDGGITWNDIGGKLLGVRWANISSIAFDPGDAKIIYVGFNGGTTMKIMRTENAGETWEDISIGLDAECDINALLVHRNTRTLFAATHKGVWKKEVSSSSWARVGYGLPNVMVSDLDIRYDANELFAGTHGRGVWRILLEK